MIIKLQSLDYRIPKWNYDDLIERYCPICNSPDADTKYSRPDSLNVLLCNKCNTFYVSPAPSQSQLSAFYSTYDENHRRRPNQTAEELLCTYKSVKPFTDIRVREISSLMSIEKSRVFDVGFGRAQLLYEFMKHGAKPYGVELDTKAIEYAKAIGIHDIYYGTIDDVDENTKYDLIMMNDIVEHPLNPTALFKRAYELLDKKGFLLIWTPNGNIGNTEAEPTIFRVDLEHMQYLSTDSCLYIANKLNLRVIHLETLGFPFIDGIDKPLPKVQKENNARMPIKEVFKAIPGFTILNNIRIALMPSKAKVEAKIVDERTGAYHLFCILQKTS